MKFTTRLAVLALAAGALAPAFATEGYVMWDDFNVTGVDPGRWLALERVRQRQDGMLRLAQGDRAGQLNNTDMFFTSWNTSLKNPSAITQMKLSITVDDFGVDECAANTNPDGPSDVQARALGSFFNVGAGAPTSRIDDIGAGVRLIRRANSSDGAGVLRVEGFVFKCGEADCNYGTTLVGSVDLGTATLGQTVALRFDWEPGQDRFNFYRGSDPVQRVSYAGLADTQAPFLAFKYLSTRTRLESCLAQRVEGWMDARFDNLSVNQWAGP